MLLYDLAVIFYTLGFAALLLSFYFNSKVLGAVQAAVLMSAIAMNAGAVLFRLQAMQYALVDFTTMITLVLACICFFINIKYQKPDIGLFVMPVVIAAGILSFFFDKAGVAGTVPKSFWIYIHIPLSVIGTGFFITAFASGIMYVVLERQLKNKTFGKIFDRFPPLATIDQINSHSLYLGFVAYTAGLVTAAIWMIINKDSVFAGMVMKIVVAVAAWVIMGVVVLIKMRLGMTARQQAIASVIGFITMLATYAAVALFIIGE